MILEYELFLGLNGGNHIRGFLNGPGGSAGEGGEGVGSWEWGVQGERVPCMGAMNCLVTMLRQCVYIDK